MTVKNAAQVSPLSPSDAPHEAVDLLQAIEKKYGKVLNIFGTMAHQPDVLKGVVSINDGIQNDLPAKLRELAYLKASKVNSCEYCSHYHSQAAAKAGVSEQQLAAVDNFEGNDLFSETEQAVLRYSEELSSKADVSDGTLSAVREHISEKELVTLAATVALANFTNRFNHGLRIELP